MNGHELRQRRLKMGLSQGDLALRLETTINTISRWENGSMTIQYGAMLSLALETLERERAQIELQQMIDSEDKESLKRYHFQAHLLNEFDKVLIDCGIK